MIMTQAIGTLIDRGKMKVVLQRIREGKAPMCAVEPKSEGIMKGVKKPKAKARKKQKGQFMGSKQAELNFAMRLSAGAGEREEVEKLLKMGADINSRDSAGCTALMFAARKGYEDVVEFLIKKGAKVDLKDNYGCTALLRALERRNHKCAKILEKNGAKK